MANKPSKYTLRKLATGSLNKPVVTSKPQPKNTISQNSGNGNETAIPVVTNLPFSEENFDEKYGFKGFLYYGTIKDTNWYFTIHADHPMVLFSNNIMEQKYNKNDVYNADNAFKATYCSVNFNKNHSFEDFPLAYSSKATIKDFKTLDLSELKVKDFESYPGRIQMDMGNQFFGLNMLNSIFLMNNDIEQIKDLIDKFSVEDKIKILETSLDNLKSSPEDCRHFSSLNKSLFPALNNMEEQLHRLHEHYVMTANVNEINSQNDVQVPSQTRKLKF